MGLPTTRFYLDDGTGTFPDEITNYVLLTEGLIGPSRGRSDTDAAPTAGMVSFELNNATGAFTIGSTILGTPSPIKLDQRIRVRETVNGVTYNRFTGYVKSWAQGWSSVLANTATVRVTATDAQARAERRVLRSILQEEVLVDSPMAYYMLGEPEGTTAPADTSGNQTTAMSLQGSGPVPTFGAGTGPATETLPAPTFNDGRYFQATLATAPTSVGLWFSTTTNDATTRRLLSRGSIDLLSGHLWANSLSADLGAVNDGTMHYLLVSGTTVYLDGVSVATGAASGSSRLRVAGDDTYSGWIGTIAHVAAYNDAFLAADALAHYQAGTTGFANESGTARIARLAGYAGISTGTLDTSLTNVPYVDITGRTAWECIQEVCDAEMGVAYISGSGTLDFHNRQRVTVKTAPDLTLNGYVRPDAEPTTDDQDLLNYVEVSSSVTQIPQVIRSTSSETTHGRYSDSKSYLVGTDDEALDRGNWLVTTRAEPGSAGRYGSLTINLFGMDAARQSATLAALEHGCWLRVLNMPSQTPGGTTVDVVVEGIAENQSGTSWEITCNVVSKTALYPEVFVLDSSVLDGTDLLGV